MSANWYTKVTRDLAELPDCIQYYEQQLEDARKTDLSLRGKPLEAISAHMPSIVELRFGQLQEIEAILEFLNIQLRKTRSAKFRTYFEKYQRQLSAREAEKYVDGDEEVVDLALLINEFALLRNKWLGLLKAIDAKQFQVNNVIKLRVAGLDDATL